MKDLFTLVFDCFVLAVVAAYLILQAVTLVRSIRYKLAIRNGAREARKAERERIAELKRFNRQKEIGNRIFRVLLNTQRDATNSCDWHIRPGSMDPFRIEIYLANWAGPVDLLYIIKVDLNLPVRQQIKIWRKNQLETEDSVIGGEIYIKNSLIPRIFVPKS